MSTSELPDSEPSGESRSDKKSNARELVLGAFAGVAADRITSALLDQPAVTPTQIPLENSAMWANRPDPYSGDPWTFRAQLLEPIGQIRVEIRAWRAYAPLAAHITSSRAILVSEMPVQIWKRPVWMWLQVPAFGTTTVRLDWMWPDGVWRSAECSVSPNMEGLTTWEA